MTISPPHNQRRRPAFLGPDMAASTDKTAQTIYVPHPGRPGCGYTLLLDDEIRLFRLWIFPLRCKSCGEMISTVRKGA